MEFWVLEVIPILCGWVLSLMFGKSATETKWKIFVISAITAAFIMQFPKYLSNILLGELLGFAHLLQNKRKSAWLKQWKKGWRTNYDIDAQGKGGFMDDANDLSMIYLQSDEIITRNGHVRRSR